MEAYSKYLNQEIKDFLACRKSQLVSPISLLISWSRWEETTTKLWVSPGGPIAEKLYQDEGEHVSQRITLLVPYIDLPTLCELEQRFRDEAWRTKKKYQIKNAHFNEIYQNDDACDHGIETQMDYYRRDNNCVGIRIIISSNNCYCT